MHNEGNIILVHLEIILLFIASTNIQRQEVGKIKGIGNIKICYLTKD